MCGWSAASTRSRDSARRAEHCGIQARDRNIDYSKPPEAGYLIAKEQSEQVHEQQSHHGM